MFPTRTARTTLSSSPPPDWTHTGGHSGVTGPLHREDPSQSQSQQVQGPLLRTREDTLLHVDQQLKPGSYVTVRPQGQMDAVSVPAFRSVLADIASPEALVIDLSGLVFMDAVGLGALIGGVRRAQEGGTRVAVACPRQVLTQILRESGLGTIVTLVDSLEAATAALQNNARATGLAAISE
jgi:anti-sigma B factor antagonist